jgi:hypothetical protein
VPDAEFALAVVGVMADPELYAQMRLAARSYALTASWDSVFEGVYAAYETVLRAREQTVDGNAFQWIPNE